LERADQSAVAPGFRWNDGMASEVRISDYH
jgi:hypothetical protein